jgi:murein DD-endopeptidase MepM/ murein hydrolase activator NlpD
MPSAGGAGGAAPNECPRAKVDVADGATLNVRPTPSTSEAAVGVLGDGDIVDVIQQVNGEVIEGDPTWFQIQAPNVAGYVSAAFASCTLETPPVITAPDGYFLPLQCGKSAKISQGNFGSYSHQGNAKYAFDFSIPVGTPMAAMADGVVKYMNDATGPGDPCYDGGGSSCFPYANYVVLKHGDGKLTTYKHLSQVNVVLGQAVTRGSVVGLSGSTGYSTGPHAHVMRMEDCGQYSCQSIPLEFADVGGDHVPDTGQTVTSGNCP